MPPEDVELIRGALQGGPEALREGFDEEWLDFAGDDAGDTVLEEDVVDPEQWTIEQRQESEAEIVRLGEEIAASNRRQEALQRYLDLLEDGRRRERRGRADRRRAGGRVGRGRVRAALERHGPADLRSRRRRRPRDARACRGDGRGRARRRPLGDREARPRRADHADERPRRRADRRPARPRRATTSRSTSTSPRRRSRSARGSGSARRCSRSRPAPHTGCKKFKERFGLDALKWVNDNRDRRLRGMNCRVVEAGAVAVGDSGRRRLAPGPRVQQRARRGQRLPGLEQRLQAGEDHRPAAVDLPVAVSGAAGRGRPSGGRSRSAICSISQVTREVPSALTSSLQSVFKALDELAAADRPRGFRPTRSR